MENNRRPFFLKINVGLVLSVLVLAYFLYLMKNDLVKLRNLKNEERNIAGQIITQGDLKKELSRKILYLDRDGYIEKIAREKLGMIKKGEKAYKVIN